ncbi:MAG: hypothetical protein GOVbin2604_65 [Gammaproteobacteria virus GOV_bin_2604]|mgnify:CR=1 FL=1|nr:MAG: hypothetical protein GOVbin2604_65 [Gammaproteobacteria virus GOV_bin_2604]|tara:strand:+ start:563 stop:751 length:189 start_codon:yes stop_codon:yes gene_type:complete
MSVKKVYEQLERNLMNARMERILIVNKKQWDGDIQTDDELVNEIEMETFERILDWEVFDEVR